MQTPENNSSEVERLRQTTRDLIAISTLPSIWGGLHPEGIIQSLASTLLSTLQLELVYIRLAGSDGNDITEAIRSTRSDAAESCLPAVRAALDTILIELDANQPATILDPVDGQPLRVIFVRFGIADDIGFIVIGSQRNDFPSEHERAVLGVGANQAAVVVQRQRTEQALQRSEMRFLDLADAAPAMLWVTEPNGSCSFLSRGWYEFTGQSKNEGIGFGWTAAIHPEDREEAIKAFEDANRQKTEFTLEHRLLHADGSYRWVIDTGRPRFSAAGEFLGFVGNVLDITDRKQTDEILSETKAWLSAVFEILPVGVAVVDADGEILLSNHEMHQYLPTKVMPSLDEFRHNRWRANHADGHPYERHDFPGARALRGERVVPGIEMLYRKDDGTDIWTQVAAVPLRDSNNRITGQVAVVMNVDAFKRTEEALRLSEDNYRTLFNEVAKSNKNLSEFLAVLAHELRNPLAPILTGLELMRMRADSSETIMNIRGMIERQANQLAHLINDLLDIARVTNGKIEIKRMLVDLKSVVSNAVETSLPLIEKGHHEFSLKLHDEPLSLNADPTRIAQVIGNLLTNAAKYTPRGGKIRLNVERDGDHAVISVSDNGIGIPAESLPSVFEMFNQVGRNMEHSQGGLGIGLSLVRQLVGLHGGTVTAVSEGSGKGSTFIVRLPLEHTSAQADRAIRSSELTGAAPRTFRILVTDDNVDAATTLASLLGMYGHNIRIAHDGLQALQIAEEFNPEITFLDIGMPGMTGYEVARRLRLISGLSRCKIVAVTGWGAKEDLARAREAGFDSHFTKPVAPGRVRDFLNELQWK